MFLCGIVYCCLFISLRVVLLLLILLVFVFVLLSLLVFIIEAGFVACELVCLFVVDDLFCCVFGMRGGCLLLRVILLVVLVCRVDFVFWFAFVCWHD